MSRLPSLSDRAERADQGADVRGAQVVRHRGVEHRGSLASAAVHDHHRALLAGPGQAVASGVLVLHHERDHPGLMSADLHRGTALDRASVLQPVVVRRLDRVGHSHRDRRQVGRAGVGELVLQPSRAGVPVPVDHRPADVDPPGHGVLARRPAEHGGVQDSRAALPPRCGKQRIGQPRGRIGKVPGRPGGTRRRPQARRRGRRVPRARGQRGGPGHRRHLGDLLDEPGDEQQDPGRDDGQQPQHALPPPLTAPAAAHDRALTRPLAPDGGRRHPHTARVNGIYPAKEQLDGHGYPFVDSAPYAPAIAGAGCGTASSARTLAQPNTRCATKPMASATSTPRLANSQAPVLPPRPNGLSR